MNWFILILGGLFEVAFTYCIVRAKESVGTEMYLWYVGFLISVSISMGLFFKATRTFSLCTAYAVWSAIGAVATVLVGIFFFKEPTAFWRIFFIFTLIASIVGLKAVSS